MGKIISITAIFLLLVIASGCVKTDTDGVLAETCGNEICDGVETTETCPADCEAPPLPPAPNEEGSGPPSMPF